MWRRTSELAGLPGMPGARAIRLHGAKRGWICREVTVGRRTRLEWLESSLPPETQAALAQSFPISLPQENRAAVADARVELVAAFNRWYGTKDFALVPALKEWTAIYRTTGGDVSDETKALIPSIAWNTLQRHRAAYGRRGLNGLLRRAGGRSSSINADPNIRETVEALLFERPHHVTSRHIHRVLAARYPDREIPSIYTIQRRVRRWRAANARSLSAVADPDGHRSRRMPAFGDAAQAIEALNALWELDSTPADVICADGKRYAIVAAIDVWSRRGRALVSPTSKATAIAALLRRCLLDWGVPEVVRTDEGTDYTSRHVRRVLNDLEIFHEVLPPYSPDKKPFIERFIGTLSRDLLSQLVGFAGHSVADREKIRSRKSFAQRRGETAANVFMCDLTAEQLQQRVDAWCEHLYGREPHAGLGGQSPFERAASWSGDRRKVDERGLDVLLAAPAGNGHRTVQKSGIQVDSGIYIAAELGALVGSRVQVRQDPADYGAIFVFAEDGQFICVAHDPVRTGIDRAEVARRAKAIAAQADREARGWARRLQKTQAPVAAIDDVLNHAEQQAARVVAFPHRGELHRTDHTDAAAEAVAASAAAEAEQRTRETGTGGGKSSVLAAMRKIYREEG